MRAKKWVQEEEATKTGRLKEEVQGAEDSVLSLHYKAPTCFLTPMFRSCIRCTTIGSSSGQTYTIAGIWQQSDNTKFESFEHQHHEKVSHTNFKRQTSNFKLQTFLKSSWASQDFFMMNRFSRNRTGPLTPHIVETPFAKYPEISSTIHSGIQGSVWTLPHISPSLFFF